MPRRYRNPFKDRSPNMEAQEEPEWLPERDEPDLDPEPEIPSPYQQAPAWAALRETIPAAHEVLAVLNFCHDPSVRKLAAEAGKRIDQVARHVPRETSTRSATRWDFTQCVLVFRTLLTLAAATGAEHMGHVPGYALLASARNNLVLQLQACEEPLVAYTTEMKRLKAMERLGFGRKR